ncbi:AcrR family transcriptional regulator [Paenibacillus phyllosphaerae]|uniref:AcrR family transcriptional regulator n=1 Tax=Paenibacillus phyllosphaerae TaxID=274593 RepID=A0A7W5AZB8_9BACL|nr:helix-turn-helix domain-containing protein [Paenibacillus phyllosphaerae]MBB3111503.1 AcrR family transcriptional regulator [Paenibacillus phyllosphaerae]
MMNKNGLREIKREATAIALADAAYELAQERGLDGFIVDDVVQKAGYSRRTFANHFSCKEEAVAAAAISFKNVSEAEALMREIPAETTPLEIFYRLMKMQLVEAHIWKLRELVSLSKRFPTVEPYMLSAFHRLQLSAEEAVSTVSQGRYPSMYTHMLAGAVYGAVLPILEGNVKLRLPGELAADDPEAVTFEQYLETMFGYLRGGF